MEEPKVSNIYFYHKDGEIIFKNIFNEGKITNKIEDDKHVGYLIFNKKDDKILSKPILNRSQYEKYLSESEPNIIAQYCIMFPKENPMLYLKEFKRKYDPTENKMEELKYKLLDQIVNDSKFLRGIQEDDMIAFIENIIVNRDGEKIDISLLFKFYEGIFDLNESEVYKLITYLDYLDSDKLLDVLTYAVYKNIDLTNYYNQLANTFGENGKLNFSDNPTRLENFNQLLIKNKGNMFNDKDYFSLSSRIKLDSIFIFIIENQISLAKYFLPDFHNNKYNKYIIIQIISKYIKNSELLLYVMNELYGADKIHVDCLVDFIRGAFKYSNIFLLNYIKINFPDIINLYTKERFGDIFDIIENNLFENINQNKILTWLKDNYPVELNDFLEFRSKRIINRIYFEKYNSSYLDFIIWIKSNYDELFQNIFYEISEDFMIINYTLSITTKENIIKNYRYNYIIKNHGFSYFMNMIDKLKSDENFTSKLSYIMDIINNQ